MSRPRRNSGRPDPWRAGGNQGVRQGNHPAREPADANSVGLAGGHRGLDRRCRAADCGALHGSESARHWIVVTIVAVYSLCRRRQRLVVTRPRVRLEGAGCGRRAGGRGVLEKRRLVGRFPELAHPLPGPLQGRRRRFAKRIAIIARKMTGILEATFQGDLNHRAASVGSFEHIARAVEPNPLGKIRR